MGSLGLLKKYVETACRLEFSEITPNRLSILKKEKGIYLFKNKDTDKIDYVGTATGRNGILHRVRNQHLNPKYLKSVFRLKISANHDVDIATESVMYIQQNYSLGIMYVDEHISIIKALEQIFIYEFSSQYNSETAKQNKQLSPEY